jgi:hypothetical protein
VHIIVSPCKLARNALWKIDPGEPAAAALSADIASYSSEADPVRPLGGLNQYGKADRGCGLLE